MTDQQKLDLLRQILTALGSVATVLGFTTAEMVATGIATIMQIAGPVLTIIGLVWGFFANSKTSLVAGVDKMDGVAGVVTTRTPEGLALAQAVPSNTVAPAGTNAAEAVAKS